MTISQIGEYRHGTYGYPVEVKLEAGAGETQISLVGVVSITLELTRHLDADGKILLPSQQNSIARALDLSVITQTGSVGILPTVRWLVAAGDFPLPGSYQMALSFSFSATQRHISQGLIRVE